MAPHLPCDLSYLKNGEYVLARYGTPEGNRWVYNYQSSSFVCRDVAFGYRFNDVNPGIFKHCQITVPKSTTKVDGSKARWENCAGEGTFCALSPGKVHLVRYGADNPNNLLAESWLYRTVTGNGIQCNGFSFGSDPYPNQIKRCQYLPLPGVVQVVGQWKRVETCYKCPEVSEEITVGVTKGSSRTNSKEFTQQVELSMSKGFEVKGLSSSYSITSTTGVSLASSITQHLSETTTSKKKRTCPANLVPGKGEEGISMWQLQMSISPSCAPGDTICEIVVGSAYYRCDKANPAQDSSWLTTNNEMVAQEVKPSTGKSFSPNGPVDFQFQHFRIFATSHNSEIMRYKDANSANQEMIIKEGKFEIAPDADWNRKTITEEITYLTWGGATWKAKLVNGQFQHTLITGGNPQSSYDINYITWNGDEWSAYLLPNQ